MLRFGEEGSEDKVRSQNDVIVNRLQASLSNGQRRNIPGHSPHMNDYGQRMNSHECKPQKLVAFRKCFDTSQSVGNTVKMQLSKLPGSSSLSYTGSKQLVVC